jgi:hypothetical protein
MKPTLQPGITVKIERVVNSSRNFAGRGDIGCSAVWEHRRRAGHSHFTVGFEGWRAFTEPESGVAGKLSAAPLCKQGSKLKREVARLKPGELRQEDQNGNGEVGIEWQDGWNG